jgi:hypothetical protein
VHFRVRVNQTTSGSVRIARAGRTQTEERILKSSVKWVLSRSQFLRDVLAAHLDFALVFQCGREIVG